MRHPRRALRHLRLVVPLGGAVLTGALGLAAYTGHVLNSPRRRTFLDDFTFSPFEVQVPWADVAFPSSGAITLRGWFLPRPESDRVIVTCTGHKGKKADLLGIAAGLWRAGNNVLLFDFRGCGDSDLAPLSLGYRELDDVRAAVSFVRDRVPHARIGLVGYSMGGTLALLAAAEDPDVRAVVADSAFASVHDVVAFAYRRHRLPGRPIADLANVINRLKYGYSYEALRPLDAVRSLRDRPIFLIHGGADEVTPVEHASLLQAATDGTAGLWIEPNAAHCGTYFTDRERYVGRVSAFFASSL